MRDENFLRAQLDDEHLSKLDAFPFLLASIEDATAAQSAKNPRHSVCLMHDAIEFLLYEVLQSEGIDIYESGQNTIGLNLALREYKVLYGESPLNSTIRTIQKHRGDAKHHAQLPDGRALERMSSEFPVLMSHLLFSHFGQAVTEAGAASHFLPIHLASFRIYRKYRTRNWPKAASAALAALLHGLRSALAVDDDFHLGKIHGSDNLLGALRSEVNKPVTDDNLGVAVAGISAALPVLKRHADEAKERELAEQAAELYSSLQRDAPLIFDPQDAVYLTPNLVLPHFFHRMSGSWCGPSPGDSQRTRGAEVQLPALFESNPELQARLGEPEDDSEPDKIVRWWELAVFDGREWQSVHLRHDFRPQFEVELFNVDAERRERAAVSLLKEVQRAAKNH